MATVYITAPDDAAAALAESLVDKRFAACVNRIPCRSVYRWEGEIVDEDEVTLLAKTTAERTDGLVEYVTENHPYDIPCIEVFDENDVLPAFADWCADSVED